MDNNSQTENEIIHIKKYGEKITVCTVNVKT